MESQHFYEYLVTQGKDEQPIHDFTKIISRNILFWNSFQEIMKDFCHESLELAMR